MSAQTPWGGHDRPILADIMASMRRSISTRYYICGPDFDLMRHPPGQLHDVVTVIDVAPAIGAFELRSLVADRCADHQSKLNEATQ